MKALVLGLALTLSSASFARQYIQCNTVDIYATDVMVLNLTTEQAGTLFISSGMQNPENERLLVKIELDTIDTKNHTYKVLDEIGKGSVTVPNDVIGKSHNAFSVNLSFADVSNEFSCFSRIYND